MGVGKRFTIYDAMDAKGIFASNPANPNSMDPTTGEGLYKGPVQFPKMVYHPKGEEEQYSPEQKEMTATGLVVIPAKTKIIKKIVQNQSELDVLLARGWHLHPADSIAASGRTPPPKGATNVMAEQSAEIAELKRKLAAAEAKNLD